jgi:hypothetical protein
VTPPLEPAYRELRAERRDLVERLANLAWLRRLVIARADLEVARLTGLAPAVHTLDPLIQDALSLGSGEGPELLHALSCTSRQLSDESEHAQQRLDDVTGALLSQLVADPTRCLAG